MSYELAKRMTELTFRQRGCPQTGNSPPENPENRGIGEERVIGQLLRSCHAPVETLQLLRISLTDAIASLLSGKRCVWGTSLDLQLTARLPIPRHHGRLYAPSREQTTRLRKAKRRENTERRPALRLPKWERSGVSTEGSCRRSTCERRCSCMG